MYIKSGSPTVTDCRFAKNSAYAGTGGGVKNANGDPTINDSQFCENTPDDIWGGWDGDDNTFYPFCPPHGADAVVGGGVDVPNPPDHR
jgi:hypothetical protein